MRISLFMLMHIIPPLSALIITWDSSASVALTTQEKDRITEMISQSISQWQNWRDLGVSENVRSIVVYEYLSSIENCGANFRALQRDIEFYVFQYLDHAREKGNSYNPEIICNPLNQRPRRKINQYGILRIASDPRKFISIDNESFNKPFKDFLLTVGDHSVSVRLEIGIVCNNNNNMIPIKGGEITQFSCVLRR
jgi:hypothetical protein